MGNLKYDIDKDNYSNEEFTVEREHGKFKGVWVLKNTVTGKVVDRDKYRNDLAERNKIVLGE